MDQLELIKERVGVADLIAESVSLKKSGRNFKGLCPFHNERTPSFVVSPERNIWHCFGCFPPGEKIKTPFGYHNIEDINTDHWVISGKGNIKKVIQTMTRQYEGDLVSITPRKLRFTTRLTADHNVYVIAGAPYTQKRYKDFSKRYRKLLHLNKKTYQEKIKKYFPIRQIPAYKLKTGNLLLYPIQRNVNDLTTIDLSQYLSRSTRLGPVPKELLFKLPISNDLLTFIGYYIAEGSSHRAYIRFSVGNHEEDFAQEIVNLGKKIFGIEAKIHRRKSRKTGIEVTLCHSKLANIFENLCGKGAENKHIPFVFQELPTAKQKVIIDAIHRGDGTTFQVNKSKKMQKSITSISLTLTEQLVDILLRCNFFPNIHIGKTHTDKNNVHHRESYSIFWSEQNARKYNLIYHKDDGSDYWILPINDLKSEKYTGSVYNLTIADDHSYVASSFAVSNCGKGGDVFSFLMELEHLEFPEALKILADRAGVTLESHPHSTPQLKLKDRLIELHQLVQEFYHFILVKHPLGIRARQYLKERGVTDKAIETFQLGFAPNSWDNLARFLIKKNYSEKELDLAGLVLRGKTGVYDRFRNRIMFPLKDHRGTTIAFSGRVLDASVKEAKYINSPETPLYIKGNTFFGLSVTKEAIRKAGSAIITEGEFDVISSFQAGVSNIIAVKGSALTEAQVKLIKRFTEKIYLALDRDIAGDSAARRGIEIADRAGLEVRVVEIPTGKDPDEAARDNPALWKKAVEAPVPYFDFLIASTFRRLKGEEAFEKKKIGDELLPILARMENTIVQAHYAKVLAVKLALSEEKLFEAMRRIKLPLTSTLQKEILPEVAPKGKDERLEEHILSLVLQSESIRKAIFLVTEELDPSEFVDPIVRRIFCDLVDKMPEQGDFTIKDVTALVDDELIPTIDSLYLRDVSVFANDELLTKELVRAIKNAKKAWLRRKIKILTTDLNTAETMQNEKQFTILSEQLKETTAALNALT